MASNTHEPNAKRQRSDLEELEDGRPRFKTITLDMEKYGDWVRELSEDILVSIFELGVKVKESAILKVDVPSLSSLGDTITQSMDNIKTQINSTFQSQLNEEMQWMKNEVHSNVKTCKDKLEEISKNLVKPGVKGNVGEMTVEKILRQRFPKWSVEDVTASRQKIGDFVATTALGDKIMIEVKRHAKPVPLHECNKFEENLTTSPHFKVGILLSLTSGISNHSSATDFEVKFLLSKNQYRIYVPNAMQDPDGNRVVWSALMAEQLAQIQLELTDSQVKGLEEICDQFKRGVNQAKICEESLKSFEKAMKKLKEDMSPFIETVRKTRESLNKLLSPVS